MTNAHFRLLAYESKLDNYNITFVINIGGNNVSSSNCANTIVSSLGNVSSNRFNVNLSTSDFDDLNSSNTNFVRRNTSGFNPINSSGLIRNFGNMHINALQPSSQSASNVRFPSTSIIGHDFSFNTSQGFGKGNGNIEFLVKVMAMTMVLVIIMGELKLCYIYVKQS